MPIRRVRGWILGSGAVISRLWPSRVLGSDVARSTNPNHLSGKHERSPAPDEQQEVPAQRPPETRFQNRVDLKQLIRIDGGGGSEGNLSQPWVDPDDDHVVHGVFQDVGCMTPQQQKVLDFEHEVFSSMGVSRGHSMRKSEESDAQEHAQWAQHVAKHGQLYRLGQAKPMGEQPRSWGSEAMVRRPIGPVVEGAEDLGCQIQRPLKILIVRHGESESTKSYRVMAEVPDWRVPLTQAGVYQAQSSGRRLKDIIGDLEVYVYHSPYQRTSETAGHIVDALGDRQVVKVFQVTCCTQAHSTAAASLSACAPLHHAFGLSRCISVALDSCGICFDTSGLFEISVLSSQLCAWCRFAKEPRIAEQQFGNLQSVEEIIRCKQERDDFGRFFYRFPQGEAGLDVYNRVTGFIETVRRRHTGSECCIVIVTHGLALRLFLMRWFQWTVEQFEATITPPHGGIAVMNLSPDGESYCLTPHTLAMIGAANAPSTTRIGRSILTKAYVDTFFSY